MRQNKNKRGLSEVIAYVLLIVISLSVASGVYIFLKSYIPNMKKEYCTDNVALRVHSYSCYYLSGTKIINLTIENRGYFNAAGFFIKGGSEADKMPNIMLPEKDLSANEGQHSFDNGIPLKPQERQNSSFNYTAVGSLKRIEIEPYIYSEKGDKVLLCDNSIITTEIDPVKCP